MKTRIWLAGCMLAIVAAATGYFCRPADTAFAAEPDAAADSLKPGNGFTDQPAIAPPKRDITLGGKSPAENDTLLLAYHDDPDTVNPITANDTISEALMRHVYESFADRKFSNPDVWEPMLAESWQFDPATREYTIHLRKGVKWHPITLPNGKKLPAAEVTARDVKFTFDVILNKYVEAEHTRNLYEDPNAKDEEHRYKIKVSLVPGDKYAVKIRWLQPYFLADEATLSVPIIPRHVFSVDESGDRFSLDISSKEFAKGFNNHWANRQMCGTGPLMFKEWVKNDRVVLERNPDYWGAPFYFSAMRYLCISNPNTALQKALQNELDWSLISEKDLYVQCKNHPNVLAGKVIRTDFDYPAYRYLGYNLKREFFKDKRVRWALGHAVPVDQIIHTIFHDLAKPVTGPFLPGSPGNDPSLKPLDYDLDKARALLDEAGWTLPEGESVRTKVVNGVTVKAAFDLMIYADTQSYENIASMIKENCRKIGVRVVISPAKWALMLQKMNGKEFDAVILGWAMPWRDDPFQLWHGSQAEVLNSSNSIGYKNPEVDKLIEELRVTMDASKQTELYRKIHRLIYDDQPYTFLLMDKETAAYDSRIQNLQFYRIRPCIDPREWISTKPRMLGE
jgi:peptide/nickel transport system substrate-binding protein